MNEIAAGEMPVKENAWAAVLGAIVGYLVLQHFPQIGSIIRMLTG
ncbi:MAG: hypothetical protein ACREDY_23245 [Bradyrhizobium sp.]